MLFCFFRFFGEQGGRGWKKGEWEGAAVSWLVGWLVGCIDSRTVENLFDVGVRESKRGGGSW